MTEFDPFGRQIFRGNEYRESRSEGTMAVIDPATEEPVGEIAVCDPSEAESVVDDAVRAQAEWGRTDAATRAAALHDVADAIESADVEADATLMTREHGKPYPESEGEIDNVAHVFRYYAELARDEAGSIPGTNQPESFQFHRYFPYGVTVHIVPSNFPVLLTAWTVAASLAAGNAVVVKPSEQTPLSTLRFIRHFRSLPEGLVSCVTGDGETAQSLIRSDDTDAIAFTGGVETGRAVNTAAAEGLKPSVIEAGGNDPMLVSKHAPMEVAIAGSATAAFHLSGQVCTSSERFFVHEDVHDEFVGGLVEMARDLRIGNGLEDAEIGPLVSEHARDAVDRQVQEAVEAGATIEHGGRVPPDQEVGWFYEPTVLTGVTPEMAVMREETFGPVAPICSVSSFEEAIELANDTDYGLGASVFTTDLEEAMRSYEELEAGMVWVNNPMIDNDAIPFGGWKHSGIGRELGREGLNAFRRTKMGVIDWNPTIQEWWYPYPDDWFYSHGAERF
ncbi:aldehyde dehydrogenase family protein [Halopenitus sp. POP-27]|uniref:aldehyde dehydrogenase family protein n=1 Tax=Halopenitus sp. POP-27 TaxID=2994425 RepID=UPI0024699F3F|nr:aldehyde dehydrogenase family protein [Halopenitus sp. POP-27]